MGFYADFWKKYVDFAGKEGRKNFWLTVLVNFIISAILGAVLPAVSGIFGLAILIPSLAMGVRRLRDGGFTPWLILLALIPFLGWLALLVLYCMPSK
ncbi:MAG: DUF805 domain-containing protein [Victivallales bacterium]|nr:DUF805 domain-containing protein [Victivallales bacterium]MBR5024496.1 DUF805 domain-containing protein [Victivallales bacterium]MBR5080299.1 DUF805 domain-containing protein [Victivallales bacterium]